MSRERVFTRDELYEKVWSEPISRLAPRLGLSDRGLGKICGKHRIPRPGRGYWQKLRNGKSPSRPELPELSEDEQSLQTIRIRTDPEPQKQDAPPGPVENQKEFESRPENRITVAGPLGEPHPLVAKTREALKSGGTTKSGSGPRTLDIDVEPQTLQRAFRIMDALLKALEAREFPVRIAGDEESKTVVEVGAVELPIRIEETYRRVEVPHGERDQWRTKLYDKPRPRYEHEPTGDLALKIDVGSVDAPGVRKTWADGKTQRVEELLNRFVVGLVRVAEAKKRREREREEWQRRWEEKRRRREERRRRAQEEKRRREELTDRANAWAQHRRKREFVAAVRRTAERQGLLTKGSELQAWLDWATRYVERTDPLQRLTELTLRPGEKKKIYLPGRR